MSAHYLLDRCAYSYIPTPTPAVSPRDQVLYSQDVLPCSFVPGPADVICGRGKQPLSHEGNKRFQAMVEERLEEYKTAKCRMQKTVIVSSIIDMINESGRFVKKHQGKWELVREETVRDKVGQKFRDLLHTDYISSSRTKRYRRMQKRTNVANKSNRGVKSESSDSLLMHTCEAVADMEFSFDDIFEPLPQGQMKTTVSTDSETAHDSDCWSAATDEWVQHEDAFTSDGSLYFLFSI